MLALNTNSNAYTIVFALIMTAVVALVLSGLSSGLKDLQDQQVVLDVKYNILNSVASVPKTETPAAFEQRIEQVVVDGNGQQVEGVDALAIDLRKEMMKDDKSAQRFPLFLYNHDGAEQIIIPLFGAGLWDAIGGFLALQSDQNTVAGAVFTHVGETPGLGAEIARPWFQDQFIGEKILKDGQFESITVLKGRGNQLAKASEYHVDGISGATITGDGVDDMLENCLVNYMPYFNQTKATAALSAE